ncbi:MAG: hypothetical protein Q9187_000991 [Circinaria calcarea]
MGSLQLPAELRFIIYYYLHNERRRYGERTACSPTISQTSELSAQFLATNQQAYREASTVLYGTQPIRLNIWTLGPYRLYADPSRPCYSALRRHIELIPAIEISVIAIDEREETREIRPFRNIEGILPTLNLNPDMVQELIIRCLDFQTLKEVLLHVRHFTLAFYLNNLDDEALKSLQTGNLHCLSTWTRRIITETIFGLLGLDIDGRELIITATSKNSMEGRTQESQLCWQMKWKNSLFKVHYIQPAHCLLTKGHYILPTSELTIFRIGDYILDVKLDVNVKFYHRLSSENGLGSAISREARLDVGR